MDEPKPTRNKRLTEGAFHAGGPLRKKVLPIMEEILQNEGISMYDNRN